MRSLAVLIAVLGLSTLGCAADDPGALASRLQDCGILSDGEVGPWATSPFYAPDACYQDCLATASCEELTEALCDVSIALLRRCDERCAYRCPEGALIGLERVCDGIPQCEGGADEEGCAGVECGDGRFMPERLVCDGIPHCVDGADERGCPAPFSCQSTWGETISGTWMRCNESYDCRDGSDERDCPTYACADGTTVVHREGASVRCDRVFQCSDRSDEEGCATIEAMCETP